jgi:hypothetical protein
LGQLSINYMHASNSKNVHANSLGKRYGDTQLRNWNEPCSFGEVMFTMYYANGVETRAADPEQGRASLASIVKQLRPPATLKSRRS